MNKKLVIDPKLLPTRLPGHTTITLFLANSVWNIPQWGQGVMFFLLVLLWISAIGNLIREKQTSISDLNRSGS